MNDHIPEIVDELYELGLRDVVVSPGARSTPLAILFRQHKFNLYVNIDERSAAFFALGLAKVHMRASILVCTSGSALGHYLPALIEAKYSRIPLILLTADRPAELLNVGAPQTITQRNIFGEFSKYYEDLNSAAAQEGSLAQSPGMAGSYPRLAMQRAYINAHRAPQMAVHINVPLGEPLVPDLSKVDFSTNRNERGFSFCCGESDNQPFLDYIKDNLNRNGIIICGPGSSIKDEGYYADIIELSCVLKAPLLADPLSQLRAYEHENIITAYDAFLKSEKSLEVLKADYIILMGQPPVSKRLFQFLQMNNGAEIFQLDPCAEYRNPALNTAKLIQISERVFITKMLAIKNELKVSPDFNYLKKWQKLQNAMAEHLGRAQEVEVLFEGKIFQIVQNTIAQYALKNQVKCRLVLANSMSIRDADFFWAAKSQSIEFFGNRGANGIDGTISTALGIAAAGSRFNDADAIENKDCPTVLIAGDLSFIHDFNSLTMGQKYCTNLTIVLLNNNGGGIFQYLPQANVPNFEELFLVPHDLDFSALPQLFQAIKYEQVNSYADFSAVFSGALSENALKVIEVPISMAESKSLHEFYTTPPE